MSYTVTACGHRLLPGDEEEGPHGVHVAQRRLGLRHLDSRDPQRPEVGPVVVGRVGVLVAGDHLRRHPVRSSDKRVPVM